MAGDYDAGVLITNLNPTARGCTDGLHAYTVLVFKREGAYDYAGPRRLGHPITLPKSRYRMTSGASGLLVDLL